MVAKSCEELKRRKTKLLERKEASREEKRGEKEGNKSLKGIGKIKYWKKRKHGGR